MSVVAVVGLSGVGKSSLIRAAANEIELMHLAASELIKTEQAWQNAAASTSEELRLGKVLTNQDLLVSAFRRETATYHGLIVLDAHTVIDGASGLVEIPADVFRDTGCQHIAVITEAPDEIAHRREKDTHRVRPLRSGHELQEHQDRSTAAAEKIASTLGIPISLHHAPRVDDLLVVLRRLADE